MLAIKPENVPEPVWHTAMSTYHKTIKKRPGSAWQEAIAAALSAWPDMAHRVMPYAAIILPLMENPDDKA